MAISSDHQRPASYDEAPTAAMTPDQRAQFEQDGYLIIRGALTPTEVEYYTAAIDRVYAEQEAVGAVKPGGSMHVLSAVANCKEAVGLIDHPATFPLVWSMLGWNVHIYHSHLDVHPHIPVKAPFRFEWHQDGGRQNRELEGTPRERMSVKLAFWLTDVSETGRGNFKILPGSHKTNWIDGPPRRDIEWPDPEGAIEVRVNPGDAVFFDRRLWHCRTNNYSQFTRKAMFFGYTLRWIAIRDDIAGADDPAWVESLSPVRQQLLGHIGKGIPGELEGDHAWGHYPKTTPLYNWLDERDMLVREIPPLRK
jgi:ectoine hydroxylase